MTKIPGEFYVPMRVADLEVAEKALPGYKVDGALDVESISEVERRTTLLQVLTELSASTPLTIFQHPEKFDTIFSYVKVLHVQGIVSKECKVALALESSQQLSKILRLIGPLLRQKQNEEFDNEELIFQLRSSVKMYCFILGHLLLSTLHEPEEPEATQNTRGRKRGRPQPTRDGLDADTKETILKCFRDLLSPEVQTLWPNSQFDDSLVALMLRATLELIGENGNVEGNDNPIAEGLIQVFERLAALYTTAFIAKTNQQQAEGKTGVVSSDPRHLIIGPLVELMMKSASSAKWCVQLEQSLSSRVEDQTTWISAFLTLLFEAVSTAALHEASGEGAKNLARFLEDLSTLHVGGLEQHITVILPLIHSEAYEIRKAVIASLTAILLQQLSAPTTENHEARQSYMNELFVRIRDLNPFVRSFCIKKWTEIVEHKNIPKGICLSVMQEAVTRLRDRHPLVRRQAINLLSALIKKNPFQQTLSLTLLSEKLAEHRRSALQRYFPGQEGEDEMQAALENVRVTIAQAAALPELGDVERLREMHLQRIVVYEGALQFVAQLHIALELCLGLLTSVTLQDVTEAIGFVALCAEYRLDPALEAVRRVIIMIFMHETTVQNSVCVAVQQIFFDAFAKSGAPPLAQAVASVHKLVALLESASEGEVAALERVLRTLKGVPSSPINQNLLDACWGIVNGSVDESSVGSKRLAFRLYSILATCNPEDVAAKKQSLLQFVSDNGTDNALIACAFRTLEAESLLKQFTPLPESADPNTDPFLRLVVFHVCRPSSRLGTWVQLCDAAISALHSLHAAPLQVYAQMVTYLAAEYQRTQLEERLVQLIALLGFSCMKHLVSIDNFERTQLKKLDDAQSKAQGKKEEKNSDVDVMHKELGLGSSDYKRFEILEQCRNAKANMLTDPRSFWKKYSSLITDVCKQPLRWVLENATRQLLRSTAVVALMKLMIASEDFCQSHLRLLFTMLKSEENWVDKVNIVIGLGDLCCVHPNALQPFMKLSGFYGLLKDKDSRVRGTTVQVCTHLVMNDMLRVSDHLHLIVRLAADSDAMIRHNTNLFIQHLAMKMKGAIGNVIPRLVPRLSNDVDQPTFQAVMKLLLREVEQDKPTESLVVKLCESFSHYSETKPKLIRLSQNIAFCLSELNINSERVVKAITSDQLFRKYAPWLRDAEVYQSFQLIASKAKKAAGADRRDRPAIEEWEQRLIADQAVSSSEDEANADSQGDEEDEDSASEPEQGPGRSSPPTNVDMLTAENANADPALDSNTSACSSGPESRRSGREALKQMKSN